MFHDTMLASAQDDERARLEEQRRKVGVTAEVFVHDGLAELGKIRFGLLKEVLGGRRGGSPAHLVRRAATRVQGAETTGVR